MAPERSEGECFRMQNLGAVVQLVRIPACHAGGRGFKSRPHRRGERKSSSVDLGCLLLFFYSNSGDSAAS